MATMKLAIKVESDLLNDAIRDFEMINEALPKCHGSEYRDLERRLDALTDKDILAVGVKSADLFHIVVTPPPKLQEIIADARKLGVI